MKTRLSGLIDGEIEAHDARAVLDAAKRDAELRERWQHYQLVGDALKGEPALHADITPRVMAALADEPVLLAPRRERRTWQRTVLAMAATVAGVALVGWVALGSRHDAMPAGELVAQEAATPRPESQDMREYMVAHQAQAGSLQFRGGTENVRTVAASGSGYAR